MGRGVFRAIQRLRWISFGVVMMSALALATGCATPEFRYVADPENQAFYKVPMSWHEIDSKPVDEWSLSGVNPDSATAMIKRQLTWSSAFDADADPMPEHMTSLVTSFEPVLYVTIRYLTESERDAVSFDSMRDFILLSSRSGREAYEQAMAKAGRTPEVFERLYDEVLTGEDGMRGVRVVFNTELPTGVMHTFDQTVWANADSSIIYFMLLRCTAKCYRERAVEFDAIATSFIVRSAP